MKFYTIRKKQNYSFDYTESISWRQKYEQLQKMPVISKKMRSFLPGPRRSLAAGTMPWGQLLLNARVVWLDFDRIK